MTSRQENKLTMWTATDAVLEKFEQTWAQLPAFNEAVHAFRNTSVELSPYAGKQKTSTKGVTEDKAVQRQLVIKLAAQMASNIHAFALKNKNNELLAQFNFPPSYFERLRDNTFPVIIKNIYSKAEDLVNDLEPYGVNKDKIEKLKDALNSYKKKNPGPRLASGNRKSATINIVAKILEGEKQLTMMDDMIGNFTEENPDFVTLYKNARIVINLGGGHKPKDPPPSPDKQ